MTARDNPCAGSNAGGIAERHGEEAPVAKANDFDCQRCISGAAHDLADFPDTGVRAVGLDDQADHARDATAERCQLRRVHLGEIRLE
jgi:hypothetical protein